MYQISFHFTHRCVCYSMSACSMQRRNLTHTISRIKGTSCLHSSHVTCYVCVFDTGVLLASYIFYRYATQASVISSSSDRSFFFFHYFNTICSKGWYAWHSSSHQISWTYNLLSCYLPHVMYTHLYVYVSWLWGTFRTSLKILIYHTKQTKQTSKKRPIRFEMKAKESINWLPNTARLDAGTACQSDTRWIRVDWNKPTKEKVIGDCLFWLLVWYFCSCRTLMKATTYCEALIGRHVQHVLIKREAKCVTFLCK